MQVLLPLIFLFLIFPGYPLYLVIMSILQPAPVLRNEENLPQVTIIIPAFNEEKFIADKIKNTLKLEYPKEKLRIILAIDGAEDETYKVAKKYEDQGIEIYYFKERRGKISVMNDAVSRTSGEIIVFSDANTFYEEKALLHLIRNFADPKVGMVCGRLTLEKGRYASLTGPELRYWDYEHLLKIMETESGSTMGVVGSIYAVRRVLWQAEPQDTILDDLQVGLTIMRQGYRVVYEAEAVAREVMVSSSRREFSRKIRLVSGGFQTVSRNWAIVTEKPEVAFRLFLHKLLRWLLPLPLLTLFWYAIRSSRQGKPLFLRTILVFLLSPIPEIIYNFIRQKISGKVDIKVRYTAFPFYLIVMNVAALVGFFRFIFNKQPVTWKMTRDDK